MAITSLSRYATEAAASFPSRMAVFSDINLSSPNALINDHFYRERIGTAVVGLTGGSDQRHCGIVRDGYEWCRVRITDILRGGTTMEALQTNTRISLSNILVTTDFSNVSKATLPFATALARQYEAKIIVAHAVSPEPHLSVPVDPLPKDADPTFLKARGKLAEFALGNSLGVGPAETLLKRGDVWNVVS